MSTIELVDVALKFCNFAGREDMYNPKGLRKFMVVLDKQTAQEMKKNGWNVREFSVRGETGTTYGIPIKIVLFKVGEEYNPEIKIVEDDGHERVLAMDEWAGLDSMPVAQHATITIKPYVWDVHGRKGTTAILQTLIIDMRKE